MMQEILQEAFEGRKYDRVVRVPRKELARFACVTLTLRQYLRTAI